MASYLCEKSLSGARWTPLPSLYDEAETHALATQLAGQNIPFALSYFLAAKGIKPADLDRFLEPKLRDLMPDPLILADMQKAVDLICHALQHKQSIGIFGDYDVDGACAVALCQQFFAAFGSKIFTHIPDRFAEGYGPNLPALQKLHEQGADLILTVDCGMSAHTPLTAAAEAGMSIIVIDHHKSAPTLPPAAAVINPHRPPNPPPDQIGDASGLDSLCATAVCFMVLVGVMRQCRAQNISPPSGPLPDLMQSLDLVALATICDIVPLKGLNRVFIKQGLKILTQRHNLGLAALLDIAGLDHPLTTHSLGFVLGPRLNAGGRLGRSDLALDLLTQKNPDLATMLAGQLDDLNKQRRTIEKTVQSQAESLALDKLEANPDLPILVLAQKGWHQGVLGIVAGRIKDQFHRPTCVLTITDSGNNSGDDAGDDAKNNSGDETGDETGEAKGSGRSIAGFSLGDAILSAKRQGILTSGGGHDMAAGMGLPPAQIPKFEAFLIDKARAHFGPSLPQKIHTPCYSVSVAGLTFEFLEWLDRLAPFGAGFSEPRFVISHCRLRYMRWVGTAQQHLSLSLDDATTPTPLKAIFFSARTMPIGTYILTQQPSIVHVLGRLKGNYFQGTQHLQFQIEDMALPHDS